MTDYSEYFDVAVRAWSGQRKEKRGRQRESYPPFKLLVFDTETTVDEYQSLKFGSAKLVEVKRSGKKVRDGNTLDEVLFYDDNLLSDDPTGYAVLETYCRTNDLKLISKSEFMEKWVYFYCVRRTSKSGKIYGTGVLTGFNLPFDMSRIAYAHGKGMKQNKGAFSFQVFPDWNGSENQYRPRFICNTLDSKKSLMTWGTRRSGYQSNSDQENSGQFLDIRQLIWGMTNRSVSLATGCKLFGLPEEYCKGHTEVHGIITDDYISYNRQDVTATAKLAIAALKEYTEHPIGLQAAKVFSPASVAKGYLRAMGVTPMLDRESVPKDNVLLGNITSTFYGARSEAHIRNVPVPVTVNDFTSMYCLVNALLRHWDHITAESVSPVDVTGEFRNYLKTVTVDTVLDKNQWPAFTGFVLIEPNEDILPVRAAYANGSSWNVGINKLISATPFWYAMPDVIASVLLTGKVPVIRKAVRFIPSKEKIPTLKPVNFLGTVRVNPAEKDFFREVTERRATIKSSRTCGGNDGCTCRACRAIEALKVTGNSGSYGIYVEMLRTDLDEKTSTETFGLYEQPWNATVNAVETAQEFCYPPVGSVITAGARLLLAVLERLVTDAGGTWLFCDTDSMSVVCDKNGSLIPCPGGQHRMPDGSEAIRALTPVQMENIRDMVNRINPFDVTAVPSILKDETSKTNHNGQAYGFAISAKRYTLFTYQDGKPVVPDKIDGKEAYKRHGLGLYLNPDNPFNQPENRQWIRQVWQYIVDKAHGFKSPLPDWAGNPALGRVSISSPHVMKVLRDYNKDKTYDDQVKPYGFVLMASEKDLRLFGEHEPRRFISPYSANSGEWMKQDWYDLHNPDATPVRIATMKDGDSVLVKSMREVIREYELHREEKYLPPNGIGWMSNDPKPNGVLSRRTVRVQSITHIGKESNKLEEVQNHTITDWYDVITEYQHKDIRIIKRAFDGCSNRQIAQLVNEESDVIRNIDGRAFDHMTGKLQSPENGQLERDRTYGRPVRINHEVVARFFDSKNINVDSAAAIERTAAKNVAKITGVQEPIGFGYGRISPKLVLAHWSENGCQTKRDLVNKHLSERGLRIRLV